MKRWTMQMQLRREYVLVLVPLLILAAAAWAIMIWQAGVMSGMGLTMVQGIGVFLAVWLVMMVAMMFPATAPMNLAFARVQREKHSGGPAFASLWIFVGAYLLIWTLFGVLAYLGANAASELAHQLPRLMMNAAR